MKKIAHLLSLSALFVFLLSMPVLAKAKSTDPATQAQQILLQMETIRNEMYGKGTFDSSRKGTDPQKNLEFLQEQEKLARQIIDLEIQYISLTGQASVFYRNVDGIVYCMPAVISTNEGYVVPFQATKIINDYVVNYQLVSNGIPLNGSDRYYQFTITKSGSLGTETTTYAHNASEAVWTSWFVSNKYNVKPTLVTLSK